MLWAKLIGYRHRLAMQICAQIQMHSCVKLVGLRGSGMRKHISYVISVTSFALVAFAPADNAPSLSDDP